MKIYTRRTKNDLTASPPNKAWGAPSDLGAQYRPSYPLKNFLSEACLSFVHSNIVSLLKIFDKLELFLNQLPRLVDIICLSETRLTSDKIAMTNINGYNFFYCNSPTCAAGSGMYVSKRLKCRQLHQSKISCEGCEDIWVETISKSTVIVGSVYSTDIHRVFCLSSRKRT